MTTTPVLLQVVATDDELQRLHVESANGGCGSEDESLAEVMSVDSNLEPYSKYAFIMIRFWNVEYATIKNICPQKCNYVIN